MSTTRTACLVVASLSLALALPWASSGSPRTETVPAALAVSPTGSPGRPSKVVSTMASRKPAKRSARPKPYDRFRGPNTTSRVVLSFDDCPSNAAGFRNTVATAEKLGVALVLFPTGNCVARGRIDLAFARRHGMYVFNHSVTHADLSRQSYRGVLRELGAPGVQGNYLRPPYGATNATVTKAAQTKGMRLWLWTVDTNDWQGKSRSQVVSYVVRTARPKDTVLMHMNHAAFNPTAVTQMVQGLNRRGIQVCRNTGPTTAKPAVRC